MAFAKEARVDVRPPARSLPEGTEEYMVHRVMQRVDVVLDQRLREAIATVVQEQTRSVLPRLREDAAARCPLQTRGDRGVGRGGFVHRLAGVVQMTTQPGRTILVNANGEPRV